MNFVKNRLCRTNFCEQFTDHWWGNAVWDTPTMCLYCSGKTLSAVVITL